MIRQTSVFLFSFLLLGALGHGQQAPLTLEEVVDRMERAAEENRARYKPYLVTRDYRLFSGDGQRASSQLLADVSFIPPASKSFLIRRITGSSRCEKVVRKILEDESRSTASQTAPGAIARQNYEFKMLGEDVIDGSPAWLIALEPRRSEKNLIRGRAWVDKNTYLVHRIEGSLAKSPSWWLKSVQVKIAFGNADGMWLQKTTEAVADVRIAGRHKLQSNTVDFRVGRNVARVLSSGCNAGRAKPGERASVHCYSNQQSAAMIGAALE